MSDYNIKYFDTMDIIFEPTKKIFNAYKSLPNLEFEFRLGKKNGSMFDTNIGEEKFNKIKEALENYQEWEEKSEKTITSYFYNDYRYEINEITEETSTVKKKKISKNDFILPNECLDVRCSVSQEVPQPDFAIEEVQEVDFVRCKKRTSYIRKNLSIDLTIVTGDPEDMDDESDSSYEVELEMINPKDIRNENALYNLIYKIFCILKTL